MKQNYGQTLFHKIDELLDLIDRTPDDVLSKLAGLDPYNTLLWVGEDPSILADVEKDFCKIFRAAPDFTLEFLRIYRSPLPPMTRRTGKRDMVRAFLLSRYLIYDGGKPMTINGRRKAVANVIERESGKAVGSEDVRQAVLELEAFGHRVWLLYFRLRFPGCARCKSLTDIERKLGPIQMNPPPAVDEFVAIEKRHQEWLAECDKADAEEARRA